MSVYEKEFFAIVYLIYFYRVYSMHTKFTVITDQKSVTYFIKFNEDTSAKVIRWQASLLAYDFDIIYRLGKINIKADVMSRSPLEDICCKRIKEKNQESTLIISLF